MIWIKVKVLKAVLMCPLFKKENKSVSLNENPLMEHVEGKSIKYWRV